MSARRREIATLVSRLLNENNVTKPPVPVDRLIRAQGARIVARSLDDGVSGFILRDGRESVIGVNTFHALVRQRFTMAHELGHLLLHKTTGIHVDKGDFLFKLRDEVASSGTDREERDANLFAAMLLMPAPFIESEFRKLDGLQINDDSMLRGLARKFGVSLQALMIRLSRLQVIGK